ncbi:saxitoxin and tetrodotoxin-binding protein 2-like [Centroberyx affinis]|uniref:saxitoxin and tetrodotoxin-binding protein 2-like n=1 Tax=Centroberyx affinis TaxID=166261 RepID=UPI003A5BF870
MFLRYSVYFLIAGLYLSSSAPTPEDCQRLLTPLPLDDLTKIHGRWNFIEGFTDHQMFESILKMVDSFSMTVSSPPSSNNILTINQQIMIRLLSLDEKDNSTFQILPNCADCLVFSINTTVKDVDAQIHTLYILGRSSVLEESDLKTFRQQAECLGFSQPPNFHYDPKKAQRPPCFTYTPEPHH